MVETHEPEALVYTIPTVAKILGCNAPYVRQLISSGYLKAIKLGRLKVSAKELEDFLVRCEGMDLSQPSDPKELEF